MNEVVVKKLNEFANSDKVTISSVGLVALGALTSVFVNENIVLGGLGISAMLIGVNALSYQVICKFWD